MLAERHSIGHNYDAIFVAFCISWIVDRIAPDKYDLLGGWIALLGVCVIMYAPRR